MPTSTSSTKEVSRYDPRYDPQSSIRPRRYGRLHQLLPQDVGLRGNGGGAMSARMKPGYKQTEVGVIPEDWEVKALSEITEPQRPIS